MRKTSAMLSVGALLVALLVGQVGSGQMPMPMGPQGPAMQPEMTPQMLEQEIELLIVLNRMGLNPEQLRQMQQILGGLQAVRPMHRQHREELRQFLLSWQGPPEQFEQALQNFKQERQQRLESLKAQNRELLNRLKDVLTYRQGELLRRALHKLSAQGMGGMGMGMGMMGMGPQGGPAHGTAPDRSPMGMRGRMGMGQGPAQPGMDRDMGMNMNMGMGMGGMGMGMMGMGPMGGMPMMQMMMQHMQMMQRMMQMMQQMGMGGMGGMGGRDGMGMPSLEALVEQHRELLLRVIAQKLEALQGR